MAEVDLFEFLHFDILDRAAWMVNGHVWVKAVTVAAGQEPQQTNLASQCEVLTSTSTRTRATTNQPHNVWSSELEA